MSQALVLLVTQVAVIVLLFTSLFTAVYSILLVWVPRRAPLPFQRLRAALAKQKRYRFLRSLLLVPRHERNWRNCARARSWLAESAQML